MKSGYASFGGRAKLSQGRVYMVRHTEPCRFHFGISMGDRYTQGSFFDRSFCEV